MTILGILFDLDGTLTLPGALDFPGIKRELGCPLDQPILEYLETVPEGRREELMVLLERAEERAASESRPNSGAEQCLAELRGKGMALGIITRNNRRSVETAFRSFKTVSLDDFAAVITRDSAPPKPHPDGVHEAARRMGIAAEDLLVVGDFRFDVISGAAAGAHTALLTNGDDPTMEPGDPSPEFVLVHLSELPGMIDGPDVPVSN